MFVENKSAQKFIVESPTIYGRTGEDTITLLVQWECGASGSLGTAVYTSSWAAAEGAEVHSQQRFHYMGHKGE